ncbi:A/G-specific DNA-adenine glycosylase [Geoalkalibacter ferrihydriticus]|uniref:Adenine DNA glycosylase n=1 Tax=Geoalkalibacter ferrihydriticus TaxID=392333 RepID=A0A1G9M627_9BACT|nr:A/G-specific adenine glycosylase [Geoalkalibacter ferrihydriticus]SDL69720.1 A/G-specific DNA-adenine glycosylase [Geoalkalibacter ferrihydriticus]
MTPLGANGSGADFSFDPAEVSRRLLAWYSDAGRDLPWRHSRDPYRIWLSEVMLQQTTVEAVIPYYLRFLARFDDVHALAAAPLDEVIDLWAGLGYYSRARNLHAAARQVASAPGEIFPDTLEGLMALPGIGRSTAGAILSIAFDRPAPILDGNVRRVLCRLFALEENPRGSAAEKKLWAWAAALTPADRSHDYAQAIMDLGATLCVPRRPACPRCPLAGLCRARVLGLAEKLPLKAAKKAVPEIMRVALLVRRQGEVLICRRPYHGLLGGMWEFPDAEVSAGRSPDATAAELAARWGGAEVQSLGAVRHAYSHFRLDLRVYATLFKGARRVAEGEECRWLPPAALSEFALHGAHKKALDLVAGAG